LYQNLGRSVGSLRYRSPAMLLLLLSLCGPLARANENCPWLNAATAAGVLQGSVTATVRHTNQTNDDTICEFLRREGHLVSGLRIEVETMKDLGRDFASYAAQCKADATPIRAIGNEALGCSLVGKKKQVSEQIVSRVRDRAFIVRVSSNAHSRAQSVLREEALKIAEQVAGILF